MGVTAPAGLVIRHTPSLCASVCIPLARKGLSCLLSPNLAGSLPVGFLVSWDQIREGIPTSLLACSWKVPPHASHTHPHHLQGCGDNQGRLLLLPQGGGRAHLTWRNISRREDRSIPSGSSMVLDQLKPGSVSRVSFKMGAWGCVTLPCPGTAAGMSLHNRAVPTSSQFLQNCLLGCFHLLLHAAQSPVYHCLALRIIQDESHGVHTCQYSPVSTA